MLVSSAARWATRCAQMVMFLLLVTTVQGLDYAVRREARHIGTEASADHPLDLTGGNSSGKVTGERRGRGHKAFNELMTVRS